MSESAGRGSGPDQRGSAMSTLITIKVPGDTAVFRRAITERASDFAEIGENARGVGAIHHRFGIGAGFVLVVDEWESAEQFEKFFGDPDLAAFIREIGGTGPAEITVTEAIQSADDF